LLFGLLRRISSNRSSVSRICVSRNPVSRKDMTLPILVPRLAQLAKWFHLCVMRGGTTKTLPPWGCFPPPIPVSRKGIYSMAKACFAEAALAFLMRLIMVIMLNMSLLA
jgi:hypothetical protein